MKIKILGTLLFLCFFSNISRGSTIYTREDSLIYESSLSSLDKYQKKITPLEVSLLYIDKPYVGNSLEISPDESLVINLREFDCTTLVENCIAIAKVRQSNDFSFRNYKQILQSIRYQDATINGYCSRLHYMTDWINEAKRNDILSDITLDIGGTNVPLYVNYMSAHPELYKHLKGNKENVNMIRAIENKINQRSTYSIVPKTEINNVKNKIQNGDIIVFATNIKGLDYSHIGIAYWHNNDLHFVHASSLAKKVTIEAKTLYNYCTSSKACRGITILRIK